MRKADAIASANQLVRDVRSWLTAHQDAVRTVRVADLRALRQTGKDYSAKLQGMSERIRQVELGVARTELSDFLEALKTSEAGIMKRTERLWQSKLRSQEDIERVLAEVDSLVTVFEGFPTTKKI
jgi:uncharacterized protein related to proFAR isomerase